MRAQSVSAGLRARVTGGDRGLECVRAERAAELLGTLERREATTDQDVIPARAVLIEAALGERARFAGRGALGPGRR